MNDTSNNNDDSPRRHMIRDGIGRGLATGLAFASTTVDTSTPALPATPPPPTPPSPSSSSSSSSSSSNSSSSPSSSSSVPVSAPYLSSSGRRFQIANSFVNKYRSREAPFGFNGLGALVYRRTYSRKKSEGGEGGGGGTEEWFETVARVVNGTYNMQKQWIDGHGLGWNAWKAQKSAQEMYSRIFDMKFLPPGRGLWAMGSPVTEERKLYAALNNCAFVSTASMVDDPTKPFTFLMDASMLGVGVGFDTEGAGKVMVKGANKESSIDHVIADSREGWVDALRAVLMAYFKGYSVPKFDYSKIRPFGTPIKGFGGVASGPDALKQLLQCVAEILEKRTGTTLTVTDIVDIMNLIGRCVVAGNVRRTAEIAFGSATSAEYMDLKNYSVNPQRAEWGWTSNNSIFASIGMDYSDVTKRIRINGEPGLAWLDNMKHYSRMNGTIDNRDHRAQGGNPCLEQTLESYELCCLVETFPARHETKEDFLRTLKFAYLYAKTVTLGQTQWPETNRVMLRNRRIGCSISGVAQFLAKHSIETLREWLEDGYKTIQYYDQEYSDWLAIPRSIKTTSVKPSGTVSLLAGATPGMHYPESRFYIRRVRLSAASDLLAPLKAAGYPIEQAVGDPGTVVVEIPVDAGEGVRTAQSVSMWEQLSLAAFLQRHWADNQVSCTVTFDPNTEGSQIGNALNYFQYQLKGISFLPRMEKGAYPQMPYEEITEQEYKKRQSALKPLQLSLTKIGEADTQVDRFCDGDVCSASPQSDAQQNNNQKISEEKINDEEKQ